MALEDCNRLLVREANNGIGEVYRSLAGERRAYSGSELRDDPPYVIFAKVDGERINTNIGDWNLKFVFEVVIYAERQQATRDIYRAILSGIQQSPIYVSSGEITETLNLDPEGKEDPVNVLNFEVVLSSVGLS